MALVRPLKRKVHFYEVTVTASNKKPGPESSILIRFFPVAEDQTVIVRTKNFARFDEDSFIKELAVLVEEHSTVVINDMNNVLDAAGDATNEVHYICSSV